MKESEKSDSISFMPKPISLSTAVEQALRQIEEKKYHQELLDHGISRILYLGFAFKGKEMQIGSKMRLT